MTREEVAKVELDEAYVEIIKKCWLGKPKIQKGTKFERSR